MEKVLSEMSSTPAQPESGEAPAPEDKRRRWVPAGLHFGVLETRLLLIVLAGILPLVVLSFVALSYSARTQRHDLIQANTDTMRAVITAVDAELTMSLAALDALASSPRLATSDMEGFHKEARELLVRRPGWTNIVLSDPAANQRMNAYLPFGSLLPSRVDPAGVEETVHTGAQGMGNVIMSQVLKKHAFSVRVPVKQDGAVRYVLTAVISPSSIHSILERQRIPEQGVVAILDKTHSIVARSRGHDEWVGKKPSQGLLELLNRGEEGGFAQTRTLEGRPVYSVYWRSPLSGWSAAIGIPTEAIDSPIRRSYLLLGGAILISLMLGLWAAYLLSRTVSRPLQELAKAAVAMGQGELPVVSQSDLREVREVAAALSIAHVEREKLLQGERDARLFEQEARLQAENANKAKDEFLAMLGHELRNPLAAITTASEILDIMDHAPSRDKKTAGEARAIIRRQVRHLARLTDDLLDAGRVILGKISLERKPVDLAAVVRNAVETLRGTGRLGQVALQVELEQAWVEGDATRLDQVVANLLGNAVKYTPEPGSIHISLTLRDGEAELRVRDSGLGLEADLLPRIFDLFVQGKRSLDRSQGGLGIGLTLVRRLVELHGGHVEACSEGPDKGSEFIVTLPAIAAPVHVAPASPEQALRAPRTIAVIEDNHDVRAGLRAALELDGHRVVEAEDGLAGIDAVLLEEAEIALVDVGLPLVDGFGVARALRERAAHKVRLIAMTGYGSEEDINRGKLAGFDAYLVKPVDMGALQRLMTEV